MPTTGAYEFKRAAKAVDGIVPRETDIEPGEWAWYELTPEEPKRRLILMICDPDCKLPATLWFQGKGHTIDAEGNVTPSVYHKWPYGDPPVEQCGFHTAPTKLLGWIDKR